MKGPLKEGHGGGGALNKGLKRVALSLDHIAYLIADEELGI